jgi:hypothetical protein
MDICVSAVRCAGSGLATGDPPSKESYRLCRKIKELKKRTRSRRTVEPLVEREIDRYTLK